MAGKIQNEDLKSLAELTGAGGSASQLPNDTKIYVTANGINKQLSQAITDGDIGGGVPDYNYILDPSADAETFTGFLDAAADLPVDGTGGSPSANLTLSISGNEYTLSKINTVSTQGQGFSIDKALPQDMRGKVIAVSFDYNIFSGTYISDLLIVYAYDITNGALIHQFAPFKIQNHTLTSDKFFGEVQTPYTCENIRFMFFVASSSTTNFVMKIRHLALGTITSARGSVVTDWQDAGNISTTNLSSTIARKKTRKVGDTAEYDLAFTATSSGTGVIYINLDKTIDLVKHPLGTLVGIAKGTDAGIANFIGAVIVANNTTLLVNAHNSTDWATTVPFSWNTGDFLEVNFKVPIVGWSSSQIMSHDANTRVIMSRVYKNGTQAVTSGDTKITGFTAYDPTGLWDSVNNRFDIRTPGEYDLNIQLNASLSSVRMMPAYSVNGGARFYIGTLSDGTSDRAGGNAIIANLKAGDYVELFISTSGSATIQAGTTNTFASIGLRQGPAQIMASESVSADYTTTAGQSIATGLGSPAIIDFGTKVFDSHNSVTTGASWKFQPDVSGEFDVSAAVQFVTTTATLVANLHIYKNGTGYRRICHTFKSSAVSDFTWLGGSTLIKLLSTDYIDIRVEQNAGVNYNLDTTAGANYVSIKRTGNY